MSWWISQVAADSCVLESGLWGPLRMTLVESRANIVAA